MDLTKRLSQDSYEYLALRALWLLTQEGTAHATAGKVFSKAKESQRSLLYNPLERALNDLLYYGLIDWKIPHALLREDKMEQIEWLLGLEPEETLALAPDGTRSRISLLADRAMSRRLQATF